MNTIGAPRHWLMAMAFACIAKTGLAAPITGADIVVVSGLQWAQVDLFGNLSWSEINAACPSGPCTVDSELNGYTMTGWSWASWEDVQPLFNSYLSAAGVVGDDLLGPGGSAVFGDAYQAQNSSWAADFFNSGWRATITSVPNFQYTTGLTRQLILGTEVSVATMDWSPNGAFSDSASTTLLFTDNLDAADVGRGGWFFRPVQDDVTGVSAPATLMLSLGGLAGLTWARRARV